MVPDGVRVVSALHTVSAASLTDLEHPLEQDVLVCGDVRADKREAAELIERIEGLRCVDCGRLEMARTTESLTALLISRQLPLQGARGGPPDEPARAALAVSDAARSSSSPAAPAAPSSPAGSPTRSAPSA